MIRALCPTDIPELRRIHEEFYSHEFSFPNFFTRFICAFVITDDNNGQIVSAGGVRAIAESVIVTDKSLPVKQRRTALYQMLDASLYVAGQSGYDQIHATIIDDPTWKRHLLNIGFSNCKGEFVYLDIPKGPE